MQGSLPISKNPGNTSGHTQHLYLKRPLVKVMHTLRRAQVHAHIQMHIQASAFPLIKPAHLLEASITSCVSVPAPREPEFPQSDPTHINLLKPQPFQKGGRQSTFSSWSGCGWGWGGASYHSLKYSIQVLLTQMTCGMKDGPVHVAASFSPLISCVWVHSQKAIFCLCPGVHICTNTLAFERAPWVAAQPGSGPEERLERYRLMAQETAEASGMNT